MTDSLPPRLDMSHLPNDLRTMAEALQRPRDPKWVGPGDPSSKNYLIHSALLVAARELERIAYERDQVKAQAEERIGRLETLLKHLERWFKRHDPEKVAPRWKGGWQHRLRDIHQALSP